MAFSNALSNALSGMNASAAAIQVRSANIANATTPGYARRNLALATGPFGGVRIDTVVRAQDLLLQADRLQADARAAGNDITGRAVDQINAAFGEPGDTDGLFAVLGRFQSSLQDLANSPDSGTYQRSAVDAAKDLSRTFNRLGSTITDLRTSADRDINATVADVNDALLGLQRLNAAPPQRGLTALSELGEERQGLVDVVATALDVRVSYGSDGRVGVTTAEGVVLLDATARTLSFAPSGVVAPGTRFSAGQLSGLSVDGIPLTPGEGPQATVNGRLAAQFEVRDRLAVQYEEQVDALANELVSRFADPSVDNTLSAGALGLFEAPTGAGAAAALAVNAAVDPIQGGAIWRLRDGVGATVPGPTAAAGVTKGWLHALDMARPLSSVTSDPSALSMMDTVGAFSSVLGADTVAARTRAASSGATAQALRDAELAATGVNTDQELESLLLIEQAYAANARVVQVVDDMMARLMEI